MLKQIGPRMWDYGEAPFTKLKVARCGLIGEDLRAFVKRAGDEAGHRMRLLAKELPPGEDYVHMLAMGATEIISPNKNGDGWKQAILIESCPTFVEFGHYHRNHKLASHNGIYGKIRDSWYNHKMGRVELVTGFFMDKRACQAVNPERGRIADKELSILDSGGELPISMSGFVPWDECSGCGHRAKGRQEYCKAGMCKYGGLANNIGRVFEDGLHLHADNPYTRFVDISGIFDEDTLEPARQADRIAYTIGRLKAASALDFDRYEDRFLTLPMLASVEDWTGKQASSLIRMAEVEKANPGITYYGSALSGHKLGEDLFSPETMGSLQKLAREGVCLSIEDFSLACGVPNVAEGAKHFSKTALQRLSNSYLVHDYLENNPFKFAKVFSEGVSGKALFQLTPESVRKRAWFSDGTENNPSEAPAVNSESAEAVSDLHAIYRLGFCASLPKSSEMLLLSDYIARHNR